MCSKVFCSEVKYCSWFIIICKFTYIQFRLLPFDFDYFNSIVRNINVPVILTTGYADK